MNVVEAGAYRKRVPVEPQTFSSEDDRARLSAAALTAFISLSEIWKLTQVEAAALMAVSVSTWERMKRGQGQLALNQDQLTRVSALVGVHKGLKLLFADDLSTDWPKLKNRGPLFEGASPIETMIRGGIPRMIDVRRHVDALRGGL